MDFLKQHKTKLLIGAILLFAFILYGVFFTGDDDTALLTSDVSSEAAAGNADLINLLTQLRSLTLDETFFDNPTFRGLSDFSVEILPQPVGRQNPFAPFGLGGVPSTPSVPSDDVQDDEEGESAPEEE